MYASLCEEYVIAKNLNNCMNEESINNKHILFKRLDEYTHSLDCIHLHETDTNNSSWNNDYRLVCRGIARPKINLGARRGG